MFSKKITAIREIPNYIFFGVRMEINFAPRNLRRELKDKSRIVAKASLIHTPATFDEFVRSAGTLTGQGTPPLSFPDEEHIDKRLALAGEFGGTPPYPS